MRIVDLTVYEVVGAEQKINNHLTPSFIKPRSYIVHTLWITPEEQGVTYTS
jgi:hypothetical protein